MTARKTPRKATPIPKKAGPSEFAPGVFVSGWDEAVAFSGSRFCVLDEAPADMPAGTHVRIYDEGTDRADRAALDRLVAAMRAERSNGKPVLVFCGQGRYRSPLAAAWYLHRVEGVSLDEAYDRLQKVRPKARRARDWLGNVSELERG